MCWRKSWCAVTCCTASANFRGVTTGPWPRAPCSGGAYHLYQGFGGFIGNMVMGLIFGRLYQRQGRLPRLVLAHTLIDAGAFVGYVALHGRVSWLP